MFLIDATKKAKRDCLRLFDDNGRPVRTAKTFEWVGPWSSAKRNFCKFHALRAHMPPLLLCRVSFLLPDGPVPVRGSTGIKTTFAG